MTGFLIDLQYFHFLRPLWLVAIPVTLLLWWIVRRRATAGPTVTQAIAPHLASALTVAKTSSSRVLPIDGVALLLAMLSLAASGPTWSRIPNPLVAQTAPLAIVLLASDSMLATDVQPSRLERAQQKATELAAGRGGALTALLAYAGTAHRVVPLTEDPEVIKPFIESLSPEVMPEPGNNASAALELASAVLATEPVPGAVVFLLDGIDPADASAFAQNATANGPKVVLLSMSADPRAIDQLDGIAGAAAVQVTPDNSDLREVERIAAAAYREALARDDRMQWDDRGWWFAWPAALLTLLWFRRGWTMQWCVVLFAGAMGLQPDMAEAAEPIDWFLTKDQQAQLEYRDGNNDAALELYQDPMWRGFVLYRQGKYLDAAQVFRRVNTAGAAFAEGVALVKGREYRPGITAFEKALARDANHTAAAKNLEIATAILTYLESAREAGDTGEGSEGADEVRFDKESSGGTEQQMTGANKMKVETAEQWMRTVDTRTADFLKLRFQLEAARGTE